MFALETERLQLRPIDMADLDDIHEIFGDPIAMEHYKRTRTREELVALVQRSMRHFERTRTGFFAMIDRESGDFVGQCGLLWQEIDGLEELEVGYQVKRKHWRKGYAAEAAASVRDYGFERFHRGHIISLITHENIASQGVARRMGMSLWKNSKFREFDVHVFRLDRPA